MIFTLRGTNGSGKSTVARALMQRASGRRPIYGVLGARLPEAYQLNFRDVKRPLYLIGPYLSACGGCDQLKDFDQVLELVRKYKDRGHLLFEGVIMATTYGRIGAMLETHKKDVVWVFLETPLAECIRRVQERRDERTDDRDFDPKNLTAKFNQISNLALRIAKDNLMQAVCLSSMNAPAHILKMLKEAK